MRRIAVAGMLMLALGPTWGCNKSEQPSADATKAPSVPPEVVVREFLEAIRTGAHQTAESLLTDLAREKTKQMDLMVAPPGSPTAKFEVGEVEIEGGDVARVESYWTDIAEDGKPQTNMFVWALRLDAAGWRIGGVATKLFDDAPLLLLNFEDPEDMIRKTQMAEQEMQRRMGGGTTGAVAGENSPSAQPGSPTTPSAGGQASAPAPALLPPGTAPGRVVTAGGGENLAPPQTVVPTSATTGNSIGNAGSGFDQARNPAAGTPIPR